MAVTPMTEKQKRVASQQKLKSNGYSPTVSEKQEKLDALNQKYTAGVTPSVSPSGAIVPSTTANTAASPSGAAMPSKAGLNLANRTFTADKALAIWDEWQRQAPEREQAKQEQAKQESYYTEEYGQRLYDEYEKLKNTYIGMDRGHVVTQAKNAYDQWRSGMFTHEQSKALDDLDEETTGYLNAIADYNIEVDAKTLGGGTAVNGGYVQYDTDIIDAKKKAVQALLDKGYTQEEIDSLAEYQQYRRNAEETEKMTGALKSEVNGSTLGAIGANAASVVMSPMQGLGMFEFLNRRVNKYAPLDVNSPSFAALNAVGAIRDQTAENIQNSVDSELAGNVLSFLYQTGMSMADSAALVATMGPASTYLMGTSAAASAAKDITERGGSVKQAFTGAVAAGAIEVLTEKFSVDNLLENAPNQGVIRAMLQQAGIEATEEMTSEICNTLVDAANMGGLSNYQLSVSYYMQNKNMSEEDAKRAALLDVAEQVALSGFGGALSGGVMAGATNGINRVGARIATERQLGALQQAAGYSPISQYGNVDTQTKTAPMEGAESTAINTDPARHTAQEIDNIVGRYNTEGRISNSQARAIMSDTQLMQAFGLQPADIGGTASQQRGIVRDAVARYAQSGALDTETGAGYNNNINTRGGVQNGETAGTGDQLYGASDAGIRGRSDGNESGGKLENGVSLHGRENIQNSGVVLLSEQAKNTLAQRGVVNVELVDSTNDPGAFSSALNAARAADADNGWAVTPKSPEGIRDGNLKAYMSADGATGFAIAPDGDIEAVFANKQAGAPKGATKSTMPQAIAAGGTKLDCYGEGLVGVYYQYGFVPVARVEFNPEYANEGWDSSKGAPYIYFMLHNGDSADTVVQNMDSYHRYTQAELDALPTYGKDDYDAAYNYRDGLLNQRKDSEVLTADKNGVPLFQSESGSTAGPLRNDTPSEEHPISSEISDSIIQQNGSGVNTEYAQSTANDSGDGLGAMDNPYTQRRARSDTTSLYSNEADIPEQYRQQIDHDVVSERQSLGWARERVQQGIDEEIEYLRNKPNWSGEDIDTAGLILDELRSRFRSGTADGDAYSEFRKLYSDKAGDVGRAMQAMQKWVAKDGDAIIDRADEIISELNEQGRGGNLPDNTHNVIFEFANRFDDAVANQSASGLIDIIKDASKIRRTGSLFSNKLSRQMNWALEHVANTDGGLDFLQQAAGSSIINIIEDYTPASAADMIMTFRRLAMLSKAATTMRNFVSNNVFDPVDSISRDVSVPLDILLSKFTGTRSTAIDKSWVSGAKRSGTIDGFAKALIETGLDISVDGSEGRYENTASRTFKMSGGIFSRLMSSWEKWSGYQLNVTDELQKGGISAEIQRGVDELYERSLIADESLRNAGDTEALYRTFQDDTMLSQAVLGLREGANAVNIGGVGLGDVVLPFAKVPSNLAVRAFEYSPVGLVNSGKELVQVLYKARQGTLTAAQQAKAVQDFGRGFNGTALLAISAAAALKGVIKVLGSGKDDEDKNKNALDKSRGQYGTQLNLSAFMRLFKGGDTEWRDDDLLMSIDFLDPFNAIMTTGALIAEDVKSNGVGLGEILKDTFEGTVQSVLDLPVMDVFSNVAQAVQYSDADTVGGKALDAAKELAASEIASFIPNSIRGFAQGTDLTQRNLYTGQTTLDNVLDQIFAAIPGLRQTLPAKTDSYGNDMTYGDSKVLNFLNSNILPGSFSRYNETELEAELDRLYDETGLASAYPDRKAPNKFTYNGETYEMDTEQKQAFQQKYGDVYTETANDFMSSEIYDVLDETERVEAMQKIKEYAKDAAKAEIAGQKAENADIAELSDPAAYIVAHMMFNSANKSNDWSDVEAMFENVDMPEDVIDNLGTDYTKNKAVYDAGIDLGQYHNIKDAFNTGYTAATDNDEATTADYTAIDAAIDAYNSLKQSQRSVIDDVLGAMNLNKAAGAAAKGIDTEQWFDIVNTYKDINKDEDKNATEKQTELEYIIDTIVGLTRSQKEYAKDAFNYSTVLTADADRYNALVNSGLTSGHAKAVFDSVSALTPKLGENSVSVAQKLEAISGTRGLTDKEKYTAFSEYSGLSSGDKDKAATAQAYGVPADVYAAAFSAVAQARKDKGSSSLKQSELSAALSGVDSSYYYILFRIFSSSEYLEWVYAR